MRNHIPVSMSCMLIAFCFGAAACSSAQTFTTLASSFNSSNGANPSEALVQGLDGNFYGTANGGGIINSSDCVYGCGTVFKVTPGAQMTTLYTFCSLTSCADGSQPLGALLLAGDGNFYGTTVRGGAYGDGTVFKMTSRGDLTILYSFCAQASCPDGLFPEAGLIQASNGNFYGTTSSGGTNGFGTIFEITPVGTLTTLYSFCNEYSCGQFPGAGLIQASNGNFYGTSPEGGNNGWGIVYGMNAQDEVPTLYSFENGFDGGNPRNALIQASNGNLYGSALTGGYQQNACYNGCGVLFSLTLTGQLSTLYAFCAHGNCPDGANPYAGLAQGTDGMFYGSTESGGSGLVCGDGCGTLFEITPTVS